MESNSSNTLVGAVARAISSELARQDYTEWQLDDELKLAYLDQGEVDFGLVARAAISAMPTDGELREALVEARDAIRCSVHCASRLGHDCDCGAQRIRRETDAALSKHPDGWRDIALDAGAAAYREGYLNGFTDCRYPEGFDGDETDLWQQIDSTCVSDGWANYADTFTTFASGLGQSHIRGRPLNPPCAEIPVKGEE